MKGPSERAATIAAAILLAAGAGCAPSGAAGEAAGELSPYAAEVLPEGAEQTFVDFGGKVHLIGYSMSSTGPVAPGESLELALYWKPVGSLGPGWSFFTHIESDSGRQLGNYDSEGALRGWLKGKMPAGLSLLETGKVYVDEQKLQMPKADVTPRVSLVVGVWKDDTRLPVLSGASNGHDAGIVAHLSTGLARKKMGEPRPSRP